MQNMDMAIDWFLSRNWRHTQSLLSPSSGKFNWWNKWFYFDKTSCTQKPQASSHLRNIFFSKVSVKRPHTPSTKLHQNYRKAHFFALCTPRVGRLTFTPVLSKEQDNCTINVLSRSETCSCWFLFTPNTTQQGFKIEPFAFTAWLGHLIFHIDNTSLYINSSLIFQPFSWWLSFLLSSSLSCWFARARIGFGAFCGFFFRISLFFLLLLLG